MLSVSTCMLTAAFCWGRMPPSSCRWALEWSRNYCPRSREEVRRYLRRKQTAPEIIDAALARLDRFELVNDRDFATFWAENRQQFSPRGARAIKNELRMKGVGREVVDEMVSDEKDEELALLAGRKKAMSLLHNPTMDSMIFRTRLGSFLQRRGFDYEIVARTVKALWEELKPEDVEED